MTTLVADSLHQKRPIVVVSIQYRLNIFAIGNDEGQCNLALRDQALALKWVQNHIAGFGGDAVLITPGPRLYSHLQS